ncbi:MAG: hypothetical protein Fur0010_04830 [Bdellovibrio sp.]
MRYNDWGKKRHQENNNNYGKAQQFNLIKVSQELNTNQIGIYIFGNTINEDIR